MRALALPAGAAPRDWGRLHGEMFAGEIRSLAAIRVYLSHRVGALRDREQVLEVARAHLPVLERYDQALYQELCGIAEGAGVSAEEVVVLNHYTDLRDIDPAASLEAADSVHPERRHAESKDGDADGGCSVLFARTPEGSVLAQTWDMHATAIPYTMMLRVPAGPEGGPGAWLLTLTGCLGMAGLNGAGVGLAINNLHSTDARVGLVWPALVRRALRAASAAAARDEILAAPLGSGHHYLAADRRAAFGVETSGALRKLIYAGDPPAYAHSNHCLDDEIGARSRVPPTSTTRQRFAWLRASLDAEPVRDLDDAWRRLGSREGYPQSICTNLSTPENPHGTATCGAVAMLLEAGEVWATGGFCHNVRPERFYVDDTEGAP
jgi:isopenicillin-N N-acyltransferase like protein